MLNKAKFNRIHLLIIVGILLVAIALGFIAWQTYFFGICLPRVETGFLYLDGKKTTPDSVLTIGDYTVSFDEYRYYYLNTKFELDGGNDAFWDTYPQYESVLKDKVIYKLKKSYGAIELAKLNGIELTQTESQAAEEAVDAFIAEKGKAAFIEMLNESFVNEELYRDLFIKSRICENAYNHFFGTHGKYAMTEQEYLTYFKENYYATQHIFIDYEPKEDQYSCEKTMEKAMAIYKEVNSENVDFYAMYKKYNQISEMAISEKGCYFSSSNAPYQIYYTTAKDTIIGDISTPFATYAGICIIKRIPIADEIALEGKDAILNGSETEDGLYEKQFADMYNQIAEKMTITFTDCYDAIATSTLF